MNEILWISIGLAKLCKIKNQLHVDWINSGIRIDPDIEVLSSNSITKSIYDRSKLTVLRREAQT